MSISKVFRPFSRLFSDKQISHKRQVPFEKYKIVKYSVHYFYAKENIANF